MRGLTIILCALACTPALAGNYATCILDKMPKVENDVTASAVHQLCKGESPQGLEAVEQGSGRGIWSYKSGSECALKKAGNTQSNRAAMLIGLACRKLYDEPNPYSKYQN